MAVCASHNEEDFIAHSLGSVLNQTIPPEILILSDDGSTDKTRAIAERLGVTVLSEERTRHKLSGINQVVALNAGVSKATEMVGDWSYLLKHDADTVIPANYVEHIIGRMERDPTLGICAGKPEKEAVRLANVSDASKIYRRECWDDIGGLDSWIAFDSHALLKASQRGWINRTLPSITFRELRPSGKYGLTRWVLTGFERASFGLPLYHTFLASIKNIKWGYPPILNTFTTIFAHILSPWPQAPNLDRDFVRRHAINEIRFFIRELRGAYKRGGWIKVKHRGDPETWAVPIELIKERLDLDGAKVLDIGSGAGGFSLAIAKEGGVVVSLDISIDAMRRVADAGHVHPHLASAVSLPLREGSMDLVILNGVLEYTARGQGGAPRDTHLRILEYVRSLLVPGGLFYLGIENRYYLKFILGSRDHYEMRWSNVLPRKLSTFISRLLGSEVRHWIYSHAELIHLLSEAGFNYPVFYTALPNYKAPEHIVPISDMRGIREVSLRTHTRGLYRWVCHILAHSGWLYRKIGPDFVILSEIPLKRLQNE